MYSVLIVDDEPSILLSLDFLMKKNGYKVLLARNGSEALEMIHSEPIDLIILDIMMPDVDGYEICKIVKNTTSTEHIKVVFISAKSKEQDILKGLELGAETYISKPFSNKFLLETVAKILENK